MAKVSDYDLTLRNNYLSSEVETIPLKTTGVTGAISLTESPRRSRCSCDFSAFHPRRLKKVCLRRTIRFLCLSLWLLIVIVFFLSYHFANYSTIEFVSSDSNLHVQVSNCEVLLKQDSSLNPGEVIGKGQGYSPDTFDYSGNTLTIDSPVEAKGVCSMTLSASSFPSLTFECKGKCWIEQDSDFISVTGALEIIRSSSKVGRLKLKAIEAESIAVDIVGSVTVDDLTTSSGGSFAIEDGDLFLGSQQNVEISWHTDEAGAYCMAGPQVSEVDTVACETGVKVLSSQSQYQIESCSGTHQVCQLGSCSNLKSYTASITNGGIYFTLFNSDGSLASHSEVIQTETEMSFDLMTRIETDHIKTEILDADINKDMLVFMTMPGPNEDKGKWMYSTNIAYSQLKPWWLGLTSFTLLNPETRSMQARVIPFHCPWTGAAVSTEELGDIWKTIYDYYGARDQDEVVWLEMSDSDDHWHTFDLDRNLNYSRSEISLTDNVYLFLAVLISVLLGIIGGVVVVYGIYIVLKKYKKKSAERAKHLHLYRKLKRVLEQEKVIDEQDSDDDSIDSNSQPDEESMPIEHSQVTLPPLFAISDLAILTYRQHRTDSLALFLSKGLDTIHKFEETPDQLVTVRVLKELYEAFCFNNRLQEQDMKDRKDLFARFDIDFVSMSSTATEAFKKIRFQTKKEVRPFVNSEQMPNEDSLGFFIRTRCVITPFETDIILIKEFLSKYVKFSRRSKINDPVPVTKRGMEQLGVKFERMNILTLKARGNHRLNLEKLKRVTEKPMQEVLPLNWLKDDLVSVSLHFFLVLIMVLPLVYTPVMTEVLHSQYSARTTESILQQEDLAYSTWNLPAKFHRMPAYFVFLSIAAGLLLFLSLIELLIYYSTMKFPFTFESMAGERRRFHSWLQLLLYGIFFAMIGFIVCGIIIGWCWYILAAVLNPDLYLPYASAAITLFAFAATQVSRLIYLRTEVMHRVKVFLWQKLTGLVSSLLKTIIEEQEGSSRLRTSTKELKTLEIFATTPLGEFATAAGLNHKVATGLVEGDESALEEYQITSSMHPLILKGVLANATRDFGDVYEVAKKLAKLPGINIQPKVAKAIVRIALKQNDGNLRTAIKMAALLYNETKQGEPGFEPIDSEVIEAMVDMSKGSVEKIIELFESSKTISPDFLPMLLFLEAVARRNSFASAKYVVEILQQIHSLNQLTAESIGALCSEAYASQRDKEQAKQALLFEESAKWFYDTPLADPSTLQMVVYLARNTPANLQKIVSYVADHFADGFEGPVDSHLLRSFLGVSRGVNIDFEKIATTYEVKLPIVKAFTALWSRSDYLPELSHCSRPNKAEPTSGQPYMPDQSPNLLEDLDLSSPKKVYDDDLLMRRAPALELVCRSLQPTADTMEWFAKRLKLTPLQTLGLYAILVGARPEHQTALEALATELMRRMHISETRLETLTALMTWICSKDYESVNSAQKILRMKHKLFTAVSKQLADPQSVKGRALKSKLQLDSADKLPSRRGLKWSVQPAECKKWCKTVAKKYLHRLHRTTKAIIKVQLFVGHKYPMNYVQQILSRCGADAEGIELFNSLVFMNYYRTLTNPKKKNRAIADLSRFLDIELHTLEAWVEMVITNDPSEKLEKAREFSYQCDVAEDDCEQLGHLVTSFTKAETFCYLSVAGYRDLGEAFGLPTSFLNFLTPGLASAATQPAECRPLLTQFLQEMGIEDQLEREALINFALSKNKELETLGEMLGLKNKHTLPTVIEFFSGRTSLKVLDKFEAVLKANRTDPSDIIVYKALLALGLGNSNEFAVTTHSNQKRTAADFLGERLGINRLFIRGAIAAANKELSQMTKILVHMNRDRLPGFVIEESYMRGFISMAAGRVANVEDICTAIGFDADVAEVLVTISGKNQLNYSQLMSSSHFQKFALKLGIDEGKLAALICLTQNDAEHAAEIAFYLDENLSISPKFLKCIMTLYQRVEIDSGLSEGYDPNEKTNKIKAVLPWLCEKLNIFNSNFALLVIRLAQGDVSVLGRMYNQFGWSGRQRAYYASLACLINQVPFTETLRSTDPFAWMAFQYLPTIATNLSDLLKLNAQALRFLMLAAREDPDEIGMLKHWLDCTTKQVKHLLEAVGAETIDEIESEEDEDEFEYNSEGAPSDSSIEKDQESNESLEEYTIAQSDVADNTIEQDRLKKLDCLVAELNLHFPPDATRHETHFNRATAKMIISLAQGHTGHLHLLDDHFNTIYPAYTPISLVTAKEVLYLSAGNVNELRALEKQYQETKAYGGSRIHEASHENSMTIAHVSESLLDCLHEDVDSGYLEFLIMLAKANPSCWTFKLPRDNQLAARNFHENPKLLKALTAIVTRSKDEILKTSHIVAELLGIDDEIVQIVLMICLNKTKHLAKGIGPLANCLHVNPRIAQAFIPNCFKSQSSLVEALHPIYSRLVKSEEASVSHEELSLKTVATLFRAVRGELDAWLDIGVTIEKLKTGGSHSNPTEKQLVMKLLVDMLKHNVPLEQMANQAGPHRSASSTSNTEVATPKSSAKHRLLARLGLRGKGKVGPLDIFEIILGIASDNPEVLTKLLELLEGDSSKETLLKELIVTFAGRSAVLFNSTEEIENCIARDRMGPSGVIQTLVAAVQNFPHLIIKGLRRSFYEWSQLTRPSWVSRFRVKLPRLLLLAIQGSLELEDAYNQSELEHFCQRLTGCQDVILSSPEAKALIYFITGNVKSFVDEFSKAKAIDLNLLKELCSVCTWENPFKVEDFPELTRRFSPLLQNFSGRAINSLLRLLSGKVVDLHYGRVGMGQEIYKVLKLTVKTLYQKEHRKLVPQIEDGCDDQEAIFEINVLDAFFLALTDPARSKEKLQRTLPSLAKLLIPQISEEALSLIAGLIGIVQYRHEPKKQEEPIKQIAAAFQTEPLIVQGLMALASGDWIALKDFAIKLGHFDPEMTKHLVNVLHRLRILHESEDDESKDRTNLLAKVQERIEATADVEELFLMVDKDCSGSLDFEEFGELMKYFSLKFTSQRLLEIFSRYDQDSNNRLDVQEFDGAVNYIKLQLSKGVIESLGLSKLQLARNFALSLLLLLAVFGFIFVGIIGFSAHTQFGTVVNSLLPLASGAILAVVRSPEDLESKVEKIKGRVFKVLGIFTVNEL